MRDCATAGRSRRGHLPSPPALKHFVNNRVRYSLGKPRGFGPRGKALWSAASSLSLNVSFPAAALSAACSADAAFGIANTTGLRVRTLNAPWRADAPCAPALVRSTSPGLLRGYGKSL